MSLSYEITGFRVRVPLSRSQLDKLVEIEMVAKWASLSATPVRDAISDLGGERVVYTSFDPNIEFYCPADWGTEDGRGYIERITSKLVDLLGE